MNLFEEVGSKTGDDSAGLHERAVAWAYRLTLLDHYLVYREWERLSTVERWVLRDAFDRARVAPTFDALRDANWSLRPLGYRQFLTLAYTWGRMSEEEQDRHARELEGDHPVSVDEQYAKIEPDAVTAVLKERGWKHDADLSTLDADCYTKGFFRIYILDGDQRGALSAMFDYEGPEAVAEVWRRSQ